MHKSNRMKILLRQAKIYQKSNPLHLQQKDLLIDNGVIAKIDDRIEAGDAQVIESPELSVSIGWFDPYVEVGDPGFEENETLESVSKAAVKGGFSAIGVLPKSNPVADNKSQIEYLINRGQALPIEIYPIGALSEGRKGENITEYYDMKQSGAIAFSDGQKGIDNANLLKKALLYNQPFGGKVMAFSEDASIASNGMVNESPNTMSLGLKFRPALAEEIQIQRNIQLVEYTGGSLHFSCVSTAKGVELIRGAKAKGLNVTADVSVNNLLYNDEVLSGFDTNYKVLPTLKSDFDQKALFKGIQDGTIDAITMNHAPRTIELKKVAFDHADFGISGLETALNSLVALNSDLPLEKLINLVSVQTRKIFGVTAGSIEVGKVADLTIFDPSIDVTIEAKNWKSKSKNNPMLSQVMKGKVLGVVTKGKLIK